MALNRYLMLSRLGNIFRRQGPAKTYITLLLLVPLLAFSIWLVLSIHGSLRFRDNLINRKYEVSQPSELGLLLALTSESVPSPEGEAQRALADGLKQIQRALSEVVPPAKAESRQSSPALLTSIGAESDAWGFLVDPEFEHFPLVRLGLRAKTHESLPGYPFLESLEVTDLTKSFVFIPASGVETTDSGPDLGPRMRQEFAFSKLAELKLRTILEDFPGAKIKQAYYVSCSDFIWLVFPVPSSRPSFSPLQSFLDRTYFQETLRTTGGFRVSAPYLTPNGGGFVRTLSAFVRNEAMGLCGMLAVDVQSQSLADFWHGLELGTQGGAFRDFERVVYSTTSRSIEESSSLSTELRLGIEDELAGWGKAKLQGGIDRFGIGDTTIFTIPMGDERLGLIAFDEKAIRRKYTLLLSLGVFSIVCFVWMVAETARGRRAVVEAERLQGEILENLHGGFAFVDESGRIMGFTERFRAMIGGSRSRAGIGDFLSQESATEYRIRGAGESFSFAARLRVEGRAEEPVILASAPVTLSGKAGARMLILIPSRDLEREIAKKFLNVFSHALKSPVHSILLLADLFRRRRSEAQLDVYFSQLHRKVQEFRSLTDNVLRFSALDVKALEIEWTATNVARLLRQVLSAARERAKAKDLTLHESIPESLQVWTDAKLLAVVINNLVDNALKYTPRGHVAIRAVDLLTRIQIAVEDSGPGIPLHERELIFDQFVQGASGAKGTHEGLGLGLHISRQYVNALGGDLRYEPILKDSQDLDAEENLAGSRFVVELPKGFEGVVQ